MNIYLFQLVSKLINFLVISLASVSGMINYSNNISNVTNLNKDKNLTVISKVEKFSTITNYTDKLPLNEQKVVTEGQDGISYSDENGKTITVIKKKIDKVIEIGTGVYDKFVANMTYYGGDCVGCTGAVACPTKNGGKHNLLTDGMYYNDDEYGKVRILAAYLGNFPCGTIIELHNVEGGSVTGVVLDTGGAMINAWNNGTILLDLAVATEKNIARNSLYGISITVKRWGW